jgi:hypothetical protein
VRAARPGVGRACVALTAVQHVKRDAMGAPRQLTLEILHLAYSPYAPLRRLFAKSSIFFKPERRKPRKSSCLYLHVSQRLSKIRKS